jgi:hypothetical protein
MSPVRPCILVLALSAFAAATRAQQLPVDDQLRAGVPTDVYVAPGHATTLVLHTAQRISSISLASPVLSYRYDKPLNQIEITPTVRTGGVETNMNLRIGPGVYVLQVHVVNDVRAQFARSFTLGDDTPADDESGLALARPLSPDRIDIVGAAGTVERARVDPVFLRSQPNLRMETLGRFYSWNGCLVGLVDAAEFIDADLLVFRVQWVNRTREALYLDPTQYGLFVSGRTIPILARYKVGVGPVVYPGQLETVYLAVQGYRLSRHNDWQLGLPPDSEAVGSLLAH